MGDTVDEAPEMKSRRASSEIEEAAVDVHRLMVLWIAIATLVIAVVSFVLVLLFVVGPLSLTITPLVLAAGAAGGFVSSLRRLYAFENIFPRRQYVQLFRKSSVYAVVYSSVPALVGMIGALMLYLVFAGGLLQGDLFPAFHCKDGQTCTDFGDFFANWAPDGPAAYAKAIVWAFIAGFSERFVPDILNRLGSRTGGPEG